MILIYVFHTEQFNFIYKLDSVVFYKAYKLLNNTGKCKNVKQFKPKSNRLFLICLISKR